MNSDDAEQKDHAETKDDLGAWGALAHLLELHDALPARALEELRRVHQIEQARLLRDAAMLRTRTNVLGSLFIVESHKLTEAGWRSRACRELVLARLDAMDECDLLSRLVGREIGAWPRASALACAALSIFECLEGRLCLNGARLAEGDVGGARRSFEALIARDPRGPARAFVPVRARVFAAAALAAQVQGERECALERFESSAASPRSGLDALVSLFALALRCADEVRARAALARLCELDLRVDGVRLGWDRAVERTHARTQWERAQGRRILSRRGARLGRELARVPPGIASSVIDALS